ncbi:MAG: MFS transporter, partial [Bacilli bacterium]|nr:MFS transporter [Bacilli bacterium]
SSLFSDKLSRKFSTQFILVISVALTALAIFGFSFSTEYYQLCLWAIPYGLGAGAVDSSLNNYVSLHYKSRQMSWLHSFWGVGATVGPYIISLCLHNSLGWEWGYRIVGIIQCCLVLLLLSSWPAWKKNELVDEKREEDQPSEHMGFVKTWKLKGTVFAFLSFFCYCSLETTTGLWSASFFVINHGVSTETAASWASLFYMGIMVGRFLMGFFADKLGDKRCIRLGLSILFVGLVLLFIPAGYYTPLIGLLLVGLGCAPIYPTLIHETPNNFGRNHSQEVIGMQMTMAYVGSTFMPPIFGFLSEWIGVGLFPYYLSIFFVLLFIMSESLNHSMKSKAIANEKGPA